MLNDGNCEARTVLAMALFRGHERAITFTHSRRHACSFLLPMPVKSNVYSIQYTYNTMSFDNEKWNIIHPIRTASVRLMTVIMWCGEAMPPQRV